MKTLKIYLKNCPESYNTKIYCIKHDIGENLESLKEKINLRVPQLRFAPFEPIIYWYDLENDKIRIACDDDLKFFMEESEIRKLTFEYKNPQESSRKRRFTLPIDLVVEDDDDDDPTEFSKRLKKIDLSSDSLSSMDTDSTRESDTSKDSNVITLSDSSEPSTSQQTQNVETIDVDNQPKVKIIAIETIETTAITEDALNNNTNDNDKIEVELVQERQVDSGNETSIEEPQQKETRRTSESNRIVISDSSDDEDFSNNNSSSRQHHHFNNNGTNFYAYSFANANFNGARPNENFRNFMHSNLREQRRRLFREQAIMRENFLATREIMRDNLRAAHENARESMRHARTSVENARRSVQNQILYNFRSHFSPLFHPHGGYRR
ncbi:hypothetical protein PVAND_014186 [Polypedilum vanderplanki]|uniref:PB1 domain-containing protein n=1 Tax=Polypedilum vanderplanki TaxID=319348 RepID=A0A9J6CSW3_POLVA|nr:hypothetical protein PVAND_014186 [Polypedilum vanderplanki]